MTDVILTNREDVEVEAIVGEHTGVVSFSRLEHVTVTSVDGAETACCHGAQEELVEIVLIELRAVKRDGLFRGPSYVPARL